MLNNLGYDEDIKEYAKERLGSDFELNKDNAKQLYFKENCYPIFYHVVKYFQQFSCETLLSWNDEYLNNMEKIANEYFNEKPSFKNMNSYAIYLINLNRIYTKKVDFGYRILNLIKQFINKYGYMMFFALETNESIYHNQYPYASMNDCFFYKISERGLKLMDGKRCNLYNIISNMDCYGLIPFALNNGLDDLYNECIELFNEIFKKENILFKKDLMKEWDISYEWKDLDEMIRIVRERKIRILNEYLKQFGREIK